MATSYHQPAWSHNQFPLDFHSFLSYVLSKSDDSVAAIFHVISTWFRWYFFILAQSCPDHFPLIPCAISFFPSMIYLLLPYHLHNLILIQPCFLHIISFFPYFVSYNSIMFILFPHFLITPYSFPIIFFSFKNWHVTAPSVRAHFTSCIPTCSCISPSFPYVFPMICLFPLSSPS